MRRFLSLSIAAIFMAGSLLACGSQSIANTQNTADTQSSQEAGDASAHDSQASQSTADTLKAGDTAAGGGEKMKIVTTIFPEYDWVMNVLGDNAESAEVTLLLDSGVDLHSYQPTAEDIMRIATCDLFIYVGGESDEWVEDALKEAVNKEMTVINMMEVLGDSVREEEVVEGMQETEHNHDHEEDEEHDESHDHDEAEEHDESHEHEESEEHDESHEHEEGEEHEHEHEEGEIEYDEHVWLSLRNTAVLTDSIADALCEIDPESADTYKENAASYREKLTALDAQYEEVVSNAPVKTLLFGDRFPFRYFTDDYGLNYYAAFVGCSAETEASFETITFLAGKVDELSLHTVMTIEGTDKRIAETIVSNTKTKDQNILTMDSMQSVTAEDIAEGTTYLTIMENNLEVLKEALA